MDELLNTTRCTLDVGVGARVFPSILFYSILLDSTRLYSTLLYGPCFYTHPLPEPYTLPLACTEAINIARARNPSDVP